MTPKNDEIHASANPTRERRRCRDIMTQNVTAARREMSLQQVSALMREGDMGVLPVVDETGRLVGVITDRDIVVRAAADGRDLNATSVGEIMTAQVHAARPGDFVFQAIRLMGDKQVRRVPVIEENGQLVGILSMADIALEVEDEREIAEALEDISSGRAFWGKK